MAGLANLGQPFGSRGRIINIPAPAGSQLAGQIQMRAMEGLGQALGAYLAQKKQQELWQQDKQNYQVAQQSAGATGLGQIPSWGMPQMQSRMGQQAQMQSQLGQMFPAPQDPLEREYLQERIGATKALTKEREAGAKQALPDRMLRQADRYLRVVDDIMSEYWYTPEGPYRDKLLRDAQSARGKAVKLIERFGVDSEAGKVSIQQLSKLDEEIKQAGGKVSTPKISVPKVSAPKAVSPNRFVDKSVSVALAQKPAEIKRLKGIFQRFHTRRKPTKKEFDARLSHITSLVNSPVSTDEAKDIYFEMYWRPEFGR